MDALGFSFMHSGNVYQVSTIYKAGGDRRVAIVLYNILCGYQKDNQDPLLMLHYGTLLFLKQTNKKSHGSWRCYIITSLSALYSLSPGAHSSTTVASFCCTHYTSSYALASTPALQSTFSVSTCSSSPSKFSKRCSYYSFSGFLCPDHFI